MNFKPYIELHLSEDLVIEKRLSKKEVEVIKKIILGEVYEKTT